MWIYGMLSSKDNGIERRHYPTILLDGTDVQTIVETLLDQLDEDRKSLRMKIIAPMTDGYNGRKYKWCKETVRVVGARTERSWIMQRP